MKLRITKRVTDKLTKEVLLPPTVIERSKERGDDFIKAGVAEEVKNVKEIEVIEEQPAPELPKPKKKRKSKKRE